jgi:acyl carrier protein
MKKNDFIVAIASALEVKVDVVTMDLKIDDIPEWDSLGHLTILSYLDDLTDGKAGDISNLGTMESLRDIWSAFVEAGIGSD